MIDSFRVCLCVCVSTKFLEIPGVHFIDLRRMKGSVNHGNNPVVLNLGPLDWESSNLTTTFQKLMGLVLSLDFKPLKQNVCGSVLKVPSGYWGKDYFTIKRKRSTTYWTPLKISFGKLPFNGFSQMSNLHNTILSITSLVC